MKNNIAMAIDGAFKRFAILRDLQSAAYGHECRYGRARFGQLGGTANGLEIRRTEERVQLDGVATATDSQTIRIPLSKQSLVEEHLIRVQVSQAYTGVPTSSDVRRFISNIAVETSDGRRLFCTGTQAYDLARFTEQTYQPTVVLAATSTADYLFTIHHEMDEAFYSMMAAINASALNTFDLVITFAPVANNGFIGGTVPLATAYTVTVRNSNYPGMLYDPGTTNLRSYVEKMRHVVESQTFAGAAGGGSTAAPVRLTAGCLTRFISLHAYDTTGTVPVLSDAVIAAIRVTINGQERRITDFQTQKKLNAAQRSFFNTGVCVLDWGDDPAGFLDLRGVNEPSLSLDIAAGVPATWRIDVAQDFAIVMQ